MIIITPGALGHEIRTDVELAYVLGVNYLQIVGSKYQFAKAARRARSIWYDTDDEAFVFVVKLVKRTDVELAYVGCVNLIHIGFGHMH